MCAKETISSRRSNPKRDIAASKALIDGALDFEAWVKQCSALKKTLDF